MSKCPYTLPVFMGRVHGPSTRVEWTEHPWTPAVNTGNIDLLANGTAVQYFVKTRLVIQVLNPQYLTMGRPMRMSFFKSARAFPLGIWTPVVPGTHKSAFQSATQSVQPYLYSSPACQTYRLVRLHYVRQVYRYLLTACGQCGLKCCFPFYFIFIQ